MEKYNTYIEKPLFGQQITFNLDQLNYRFQKLQKIDVTNNNNQKEYLMVFDSFFVLFRAMFLENGNKQYSIQNYLKATGQETIANQIDFFLDGKMFNLSEISICTVIKFLADKFVCHVDPITYEDLGQANFYMSFLGNPYQENNVIDIIKSLTNIMLEAKLK